MRNNIYKLAILLVSLVLTQTAFADVKIKSKQTMSGQSYENTTYIKGKRQRTESMNGMMINLNQCDLRRGVQINPRTKTYMINEYQQDRQTPAKTTGAPAKSTALSARADGDHDRHDQGHGRAQADVRLHGQAPDHHDGNRLVARRLRQKQIQNADGRLVYRRRIRARLRPYAQYQSTITKSKPTCQDKYQMKTVGTAKRGYPVYEKMTMFDESGKETIRWSTRWSSFRRRRSKPVCSISRQATARSTTPRRCIAPEIASSSSTTMGSSRPSGSTSGISQSVKNLSQSSAEDSPSVGAKKAGVVRIGLAGVKTGAVGEGISAADLSAAVQNTLMQYLKVPNVEVITLDARLSSAIDSEAKQKECDYVLFINASHKKGGGGGFGMFSKVLAPAIGATGIGHTGSTAGNIAGQVAAQSIVSAGSASASVKSKDEITLDVKMQQPGGAAVLTKQVKKKASSNGEDIITPLVEQIAQAVVDTAGK